MKKLNLLKFKEAPATKLKLKKAIENGSILVYYKHYPNTHGVNDFIEVNPEKILCIWGGLSYAPKYRNPEDFATGSIGGIYSDGNYYFVLK